MYSGNIPKTLIALAGLAVSLTGASPAGATILVSNLDQPTRHVNVLPRDGWAAQSFATDGASYALSSVQVLLGNLAGAPSIVAELRTGDASTPGATLAAFSIAGVPIGSPAPVTLTPIGDVVTLNAGTHYWLVLGASNRSGTFTWSYAEGNAIVGPGSLGNYNYSADSGVSWTNYGSDNPFQLEVDVSPVPLPATAWLLGTGLLTLVPLTRKGRRGNSCQMGKARNRGLE